MAVNEALRLTTKAIIINTSPDVCWTPFGPLMVPVPYQIWATLDLSIKLSPTVSMGGLPVFTTDSRLSTVAGDEPGIGGGLLSGVNLGQCRPDSYSPSVRINGQHAVGHNARFLMNCKGPDGPPNTVGRALYLTVVEIAEMARDNEALDENFPYSDTVFAKIKAMRAEILEYSEQYGVPPASVAGAIADEYNSHGWFDRWQDQFISSLPEADLELDRMYDFDTKFLNAFKHDLGPGNIKFETAWSLYENSPGEFPNITNYGSMADYMLTDEGTAKLAALFMADAQRTYGPLLDTLPQELKEAVLVTSYKRGIENYDLGKKLAELDPYTPGDGIRTLMQRDELLRALGLLNDGADTDGVRITKP